MSGAELQAIVEVSIAALLGAFIGIERSLAGKIAGMRTYALVSMGSCLLTVVSILVTSRYIGVTMFDPLRVTAGIVMGIGFIGSGLLGKNENQPTGLTTSAGVWVAAAVGIAVAFGYHALAIATTIFTILIFGGFSKIEEGMEKRFGKK